MYDDLIILKKLDAVVEYTMTDADKALRKVFNSKKSTIIDLTSAIYAWFESYGLKRIVDVKSDYVEMLISACVSENNMTDKQVVKSILAGNFALNKVCSANKFMNVFLNHVAEDCVLAGTVKTRDLAPEVRAKYDKMIAEKKALKESKKNK